MTTDPRSYVDRIRYGAVDPWVGDAEHGPAYGARASALVVIEELATLAADDPRRAELEAQKDAWVGLADELDAETSRILKAAGRDDATNPAFKRDVEAIALELVRARNAPPAGPKPLRHLSVRAQPADPLGLRISIGSGSKQKGGLVKPDEGYLVYRGDPGEVLELLERVTVSARKSLPVIARQVGGQG